MCNEVRPFRFGVKQGSGVPTIPASSDHQDGTWLATDIYEGEMYQDTDTGLVYTRDAINGITNANGTPVASVLNSTTIPIGDWDMVTDTGIIVTNPIPIADVRYVNVSIYSDLSQLFPIDYSGGGSWELGGANIFLVRTPSGFFDDFNFDSTSFNRGWIIIYHA